VAITQPEIVIAHKSAISDSRPQLIPKIIHQVFHDWHGTGIPGDWDDVRNSCINKHEGWVYKVRSTSQLGPQVCLCHKC
jgi:mannosyltransferase OCH1-like enzyme